MAEMHALVRTNKKGEPFIGRCIKCGKGGLRTKDMQSPCDNTKGMPNEVAVLKAISGDTHDG